MYFEFDDYRPDISPVGQAISWREGVLISIIVHLVAVIVVLLVPRLFPYDPTARPQAFALPDPNEQAPRFVFVQPRVDRKAVKPPDLGPASDQDRLARSPERPPKPTDPLPFSRGNTPEPVESVQQPAARP